VCRFFFYIVHLFWIKRSVFTLVADVRRLAACVSLKCDSPTEDGISCTYIYIHNNNIIQVYIVTFPAIFNKGKTNSAARRKSPRICNSAVSVAPIPSISPKIVHPSWEFHVFSGSAMQHNNTSQNYTLHGNATIIFADIRATGRTPPLIGISIYAVGSQVIEAYLLLMMQCVSSRHIGHIYRSWWVCVSVSINSLQPYRYFGLCNFYIIFVVHRAVYFARPLREFSNFSVFATRRREIMICITSENYVVKRDTKIYNDIRYVYSYICRWTLPHDVPII